MKNGICLLVLLIWVFQTNVYSNKIVESLPPACPTIITSGVDASCNGFSNGQATVTILVASTGPYTYTWSNGTIVSTAALSSTITGLAVGTYTVNVKDESTGCVVVGAVVVDAPDPIAVSGVISNVNCFGNATGSVNVTVTGGTPGYAYSWTGPTTSGSEDLTGAPAGTYTLVVTDSKFCTNNTSYTISQPIEALNQSFVISDVDCFGTATGDIDLTVWGGTSPYSYSWSTGSSAQDLTNVTQGTYTVLITDAKGCTLTNGFTINQPAALTGTLNSTDVNCNGAATGSLFFSPSGGTPGYIYQWSNSTSLFSETGPNLVNVVADNYTVIVTDSKGCTTTASGVISQPPALVLSNTFTNVNCYGGSDGSINLTVTGGTAAYSYNWINSLGGTVSTSEDLTAVPASVYSVTVTDALGCTATLTQEITQPNTPFSVIEAVTNVLCFGQSTGSIDLTVTGATPPYSYLWSTSFTTEDLVNVVAGTYSYTITDLNGCMYSNSVVISQPAAALLVTNAITDVNCFGELNGEIDLTVTGGTTPYAYTWANSTFLLSTTTQDLNGFAADTYNFQVTDANGCTFEDTLVINQPPLLETSLTGVNILCFGGNNGSVNQTVTGGVTPYIYSWNNGSVTEDISLLVAGFYEVTVTDLNGCTASANITLTQPTDSLNFSFEVVDVKCNDGTDGSIDLTVTGGTIPYGYLWSNGATTPMISNLNAGNYVFVVTDLNGCQISDSVFVDQPDALTLNEVIVPVSCFGLSDGSIDVSPLGGTPPYDFTWFNSTFALSAQTEDLNGFPADIYQVEILDSNNCFYEMFFQIDQPALLEATYTFTNVSCFGGTDGNIFVTITGGNPAYTTTWSDSSASTTEDLLNIPAGQYNLAVVDTKNCTDSISVEISEPDPITMTFQVTEVSCADQEDGTVLVLPAGGNGGYTYVWSNGDTTDFIDELPSQLYAVTVTDLLGCTGQGSAFVPLNPDPCISPVNAFSPNGDAYNDTWVMENIELYPDMELQVFNKWGNLVHSQKGLYTPWDGTVNGNALPSETYYYILDLKFKDIQPYTGNITIVR